MTWKQHHRESPQYEIVLLKAFVAIWMSTDHSPRFQAHGHMCSGCTHRPRIESRTQPWLEILKAFESGILRKSKGQTQEVKKHIAAAEATFKKDARINIRLSSRDLRSLQAKALREGMPYQTLVSSVLHKYIDGQLIEKSS